MKPRSLKTLSLKNRSLLRFFFPDFTQRTFQEELMDQPYCNENKLYRTIRQFALINTLFSFSVALFKKHFLPIMLKESKQTWTILDLGAGGADIDRALVSLFRKKRLQVHITTVDHNPKIVTWAKELCHGYPEITPVQGSALDLSRLGPFDFIISNHLLHHLSFDEIVLVTSQARTYSRYGYLFNDLKRSLGAYLGYSLFAALFTWGSFAFYDGRLSLRRGFTKKELKTLFLLSSSCSQPLPKPSVLTQFPARIYLLEYTNKDIRDFLS